MANKGYRPAPIESLPPGRQSLDATIQEVMAYRRESARVVWRKISDGTYKSYKDGNKRLIEWASVLEDRDRCIALGPQLSEPPTKRKTRGRTAAQTAEDPVSAFAG
jgi:hypothetical protein